MCYEISFAQDLHSGERTFCYIWWQWRQHIMKTINCQCKIACLTLQCSCKKYEIAYKFKWWWLMPIEPVPQHACMASQMMKVIKMPLDQIPCQSCRIFIPNYLNYNPSRYQDLTSNRTIILKHLKTIQFENVVLIYLNRGNDKYCWIFLAFSM